MELPQQTHNTSKSFLGVFWRVVVRRHLYHLCRSILQRIPCLGWCWFSSKWAEWCRKPRSDMQRNILKQLHRRKPVRSPKHVIYNRDFESHYLASAAIFQLLIGSLNYVRTLLLAITIAFIWIYVRERHQIWQHFSPGGLLKRYSPQRRLVML